jgi:hypothetical protein
MVKGKVELEQWRESHIALSRKGAIRAFCYDCMGEYNDEEKDCKNINCPLYPFQPYSSYVPPKTE